MSTDQLKPSQRAIGDPICDMLGGYQAVFDAIASATRSPMGSAGVSVSVAKFCHTIAPHVSLTPSVDDTAERVRELGELIRELLPLAEPARLREQADAMENKIDRMPVRQIFRRAEATLNRSTTDA